MQPLLFVSSLNSTRGSGSGFSGQCSTALRSWFLRRLTIAVRGGIITTRVFPEIVYPSGREDFMMQFLRKICTDDQGQDIAEYAVMLAVILVLVIGTVRLIGGNANNAFSSVASSLGTQ